MSGLFSRVLVALVGLPLVLGAVWAGGWWLFTLVGIAAVVAVHEFVTMARPLRPLAPAVYIGGALALLGAQKGGVVWLLGGFLTSLPRRVRAQRAGVDARAGDCRDRLERPGRGVDRHRARRAHSAARGCTTSRGCSLSPCC